MQGKWWGATKDAYERGSEDAQFAEEMKEAIRRKGKITPQLDMALSEIYEGSVPAIKVCVWRGE